jgi:predicted nucleic-acid-binding Zn-ribbon protein
MTFELSKETGQSVLAMPTLRGDLEERVAYLLGFYQTARVIADAMHESEQKVANAQTGVEFYGMHECADCGETDFYAEMFSDSNDGWLYPDSFELFRCPRCGSQNIRCISGLSEDYTL